MDVRSDVTCQYGMKSMVNRFHQYLRHHGINHEIVTAAIDGRDTISPTLTYRACAIDITTMPAEKGTDWL